MAIIKGNLNLRLDYGKNASRITNICSENNTHFVYTFVHLILACDEAISTVANNSIF